MLERRKISIGFISIIVVVICVGLNSHWQLSKISQGTDDLYQHPFAVSNAASNIKFHLVSMHRYMKDVVLANNEKQTAHHIELIRWAAIIIYYNYYTSILA